jgi:hypothetical protein
MSLVVNAQMRRTQVDVIPEVIVQIHNDGFGSAADYNPLEGDVARRINFLVRKPRRDIEEIARLQGGIKLPSVAPANVRRAAEDIGDRVLLSMMMYSGAGSRLDGEETSPHRRLYAGPCTDSGKAL